jgi:hypothetical protein
VTVNPYSPPTGPIEPAGDVAVPRSFARRLSLILAVVGFVGFWGGGFVIIAGAAKDGVSPAVGLALGTTVLLAMVAHLVGVAIVFAAPRGRRLLPALLNGVSLAIMTAITVLGYLSVPAA